MAITSVRIRANVHGSFAMAVVWKGIFQLYYPVISYINQDGCLSDISNSAEISYMGNGQIRRHFGILVKPCCSCRTNSTTTFIFSHVTALHTILNGHALLTTMGVQIIFYGG